MMVTTFARENTAQLRSFAHLSSRHLFGLSCTGHGAKSGYQASSARLCTLHDMRPGTNQTTGFTAARQTLRRWPEASEHLIVMMLIGKAVRIRSRVDTSISVIVKAVVRVHCRTGLGLRAWSCRSAMAATASCTIWRLKE